MDILQEMLEALGRAIQIGLVLLFVLPLLALAGGYYWGHSRATPPTLSTAEVEFRNRQSEAASGRREYAARVRRAVFYVSSRFHATPTGDILCLDFCTVPTSSGVYDVFCDETSCYGELRR